VAKPADNAKPNEDTPSRWDTIPWPIDLRPRRVFVVRKGSTILLFASLYCDFDLEGLMKVYIYEAEVRCAGRVRMLGKKGKKIMVPPEAEEKEETR
jgi:hypothetical protein